MIELSTLLVMVGLLVTALIAIFSHLYKQIAEMRKKLVGVYTKEDTQEYIKLFIAPLTQAVEEMRKAVDRLNDMTARLDKSLETTITEMKIIQKQVDDDD